MLSSRHLAVCLFIGFVGNDRRNEGMMAMHLWLSCGWLVIINDLHLLLRVVIVAQAHLLGAHPRLHRLCNTLA